MRSCDTRTAAVLALGLDRIEISCTLRCWVLYRMIYWLSSLRAVQGEAGESTGEVQAATNNRHAWAVLRIPVPT